MKSNKIGMVDASRKETQMFGEIPKRGVSQSKQIISLRTGTLELAKSDGTVHQILVHDDGQLYGQLVNPQRLAGYGSAFRFEYVNKDTFDLYKQFIDTKKTRFYEGAVAEYGKAKR